MKTMGYNQKIEDFFKSRWTRSSSHPKHRKSDFITSFYQLISFRPLSNIIYSSLSIRMCCC